MYTSVLFIYSLQIFGYDSLWYNCSIVIFFFLFFFFFFFFSFFFFFFFFFFFLYYFPCFILLFVLVICAFFHICMFLMELSLLIKNLNLNLNLSCFQPHTDYSCAGVCLELCRHQFR
jgi:hypothetical protein